jgi:hypothetical protein
MPPYYEISGIIFIVWRKFTSEKCLMDEELDDPCVVYDKINDYKQAVENGTKVAGIHVDVIED